MNMALIGFFLANFKKSGGVYSFLIFYTSEFCLTFI